MHIYAHKFKSSLQNCNCVHLCAHNCSFVCTAPSNAHTCTKVHRRLHDCTYEHQCEDRFVHICVSWSTGTHMQPNVHIWYTYVHYTGHMCAHKWKSGYSKLQEHAHMHICTHQVELSAFCLHKCATMCPAHLCTERHIRWHWKHLCAHICRSNMHICAYFLTFTMLIMPSRKRRVQKVSWKEGTGRGPPFLSHSPCATSMSEDQ